MLRRTLLGPFAVSVLHTFFSTIFPEINTDIVDNFLSKQSGLEIYKIGNPRYRLLESGHTSALRLYFKYKGQGVE